MRILFISQYYTPETGAAAARIGGFVKYLSRSGNKITVVTGFPNYPYGRIYPGYRSKWVSKETKGDVSIFRTWVHASPKKTALHRLFNYLSFMFSSFRGALKSKDEDVVIATSGPIFVGLSGYLVSSIKKIPFVLDVRDIWPERITVAANLKDGVIIKILEKLELFLYKKEH